MGVGYRNQEGYADPVPYLAISNMNVQYYPLMFADMQGTRVLPITEDVAEMFRAIIEDRNAPKAEKVHWWLQWIPFLRWQWNATVVAMHWQHRFKPHGRQISNDIYRVQMPNITPSCMPTHLLQQYGKIREWIQRRYSTSWASGYNCYNECTQHISFDDAEEELKRMEEFRRRRRRLSRRRRNRCRRKCLKLYNMEMGWRSGIDWGRYFCGKSRFRGYNIIRVI